MDASDPVQRRHQQLLDLLRQHRMTAADESADADALISLEHRLRWQLITLAWMRDDLESPPGGDDIGADEAFAELATRWLSPSSAAHRIAGDAARAWLAAGGEPASGVLKAMRLFPQPIDEAGIEALYAALPAQRPALIRLWTAQGLKLSETLLNHASAAHQPVLLQAAAMHYRALRSHYRLEMFRETCSQPPGSCADEVVREAVLGSLVRGGTEIESVLPRALEAGTSEQGVHEWMRLLALSGSDRLWPLLRQYVRQRPQSAIELLVVHARPLVVPELLRLLGEPRHAHRAMRAWELLTGKALVMRPRLSVVGEQPETARDDHPMLPDHDMAVLWWEQVQASWHPGHRYHRGHPVTLAALGDSACQHIGTLGQLLQDWLAVEACQPLDAPVEGWQLDRQTRIRLLAGITDEGRVRDRSA